MSGSSENSLCAEKDVLELRITFKSGHEWPECPDPGLVEERLPLDERLADQAVADPQEACVATHLRQKERIAIPWEKPEQNLVCDMRRGLLLPFVGAFPLRGETTYYVLFFTS